jgi:hypothetical protein
MSKFQRVTPLVAQQNRSEIATTDTREGLRLHCCGFIIERAEIALAERDSANGGLVSS